MEVKGIDLLNAMKAAHKEPPKTPRVTVVKTNEKTPEPQATPPPVGEFTPKGELKQGELEL